MKSIVTGCAGFIGSHLAERLLKEGHEVVGIDNFSDYYPKEIKEKNIENLLEAEGFQLIEEDINNLNLKEIVEGADYVFHQAAQAGVRASWGENFKIYTDSNILATQALLEAVKDANIKKFVYASSSSVYGDVDSLPMRETDNPRPVSPYGVSKLAGEHLCYLYWKNFGVPTVSLRYFTVYGERQRPDMAFHRFIKAILTQDEIVVYGDGRQTRDFTYVRDIVEANILAVKYAKSGEVFNIGGGNRISINEVIRILEELTGLKAKVKYIEKQKGDVRDTYADISKAKKELGYNPRVDIKEGLKREIEWIKSYYNI
jgi:UDP-glucose 4-epimerase